MGVSVDLTARTGPAQKELEQFGKKLTGLAKLWEGAFGGKGQRQAGQNLQQLSKGLQALTKQAEAAQQRLQRINQTLEQVTSKRKALEGTMGAVSLRDKDSYKLVADQERMLTRQKSTWQAIAATRASMVANAAAAPGGPPPPTGAPGGGSPAPGGSNNLAGRFASPLAQFAQTVGGGLGGPLVRGLIGGTMGAALGGLVVHAIREAADSQKEAADFIPRMRPGHLAGTNAFGLTARMRGVGMPFGFNTRESMGVFSSMSEGGSNFGGGLERDSRTAMQMGRMFGIDAGGEASMLASAQRTGAFKAGDAKRFAGMLAEQIARTGLGPRAQEVQEATLMLLNQQVHQLGTANPGPIMALQTMFNKTGIAGLQGMNGANVISRLQDAVTNPGSEASEALNFSVFRKMGAKSLYDVKYLQEEGLNNKKYLPTLFQTVEGSAQNTEGADLALKDHTGGALSLHMLRALRGKLGGRLSNLTTGSLTDIEGMLGHGAGFVAKGGAGAMENMPGNQLRKIEAHLHDILMKIGEPALDKLIKLADKADQTATSLQGILTSNATIAHKTTAMADLMMRQAGMDPNSAEFHAMHRGAQAAGGIIQSGVNEFEKSRQFERMHPGQRRRLGQILDEKWGLREPAPEVVGSKWNMDEYLPDGTRRRGPKGSPTNPAGALVGPAGQAAIQVHIHDHSTDSHNRIKATVKQAIHEHQQDSVRAQPNSRNKRH
jgi:hypothetical protein